jgi:hypothetical protein
MTIPGRWQGVTAEVLFQRLAEYVEDAEECGEPMDWRGVADRMIAWRTNEGKADGSRFDITDRTSDSLMSRTHRAKRVRSCRR